MDLGAYINIENLSTIARENGISVPRLRGYRLMKDEKPVVVKDVVDFGYDAYNCIQEYFVRRAVKAYTLCQLEEYSLTKNKTYASRYVRLDTYTDRCVNRYYDYFGKDRKKPFPWNRFHGKLRKKLKLLYKQCYRRTKAQYDAWNKYCGREDVLYIHARIGGLNWDYFDGPEIAKQPWFLERVDDSFDSTYCDIYAKLKRM